MFSNIYAIAYCCYFYLKQPSYPSPVVLITNLGFAKINVTSSINLCLIVHLLLKLFQKIGNTFQLIL